MGTYLKKYLEKGLCHENRHDCIQHYKGQSYNGSSLVLAKNPETNYEVVTFINTENKNIDDITSFEWSVTGKGKDAKINVKFNNINEDILDERFILCFETNSFYKNLSSAHFMRFPKNKIINVFLSGSNSPEINLDQEGVTFEYLNNISLGAVYTFNIVDLFPLKMSKYIRRKINLFQNKHNTLLPDDFEFHFNIRPIISNTEGIRRNCRECITDYKTVKFLYKDYK